MSSQRYAKYIKLTLYLAVVVLLNLVGRTLFARVDLTSHRIYSLSQISRQVVATLTEPLTINVFFTRNLPAPYNGTALYLQDLLQEYAQHANRHFSYRFYDVSPESEGLGDDQRANRQMARDYGIDPVQIQAVEKDEVKFKQAYMGLVIIHGDIIERVSPITTTDGLEYKISTSIQKLNHKVSALLGLSEDVQVKLIFSASLANVAPYLGFAELDAYPGRVKEAVARLNGKVYDKLRFSQLDPGQDPAVARLLEQHNLIGLNWPAIPKAGIAAGEGVIGILLQYKDQVREIPLLSKVRLPIFGTRYQLIEPEEIDELININLERLLNINEELGYLADFGTLNLQRLGQFGPPGMESLDMFNELMNRSYTLKSVEAGRGAIPAGLKTLIIAQPGEKFSDYALYQIDQALMHGTNLAIFADAFKEVQPPGQQPFMANQAPSFTPFDSGLEKLLAHYGVRIRAAMVMDEKCYHRRLPPQQGGGDQAVYFAPILQRENINRDLGFMANIKGLVTVKVSPLELDAQRIAAQQLTTHSIFVSSSRSWSVRDTVTLDPMFLQPPGPDKEMHSMPLAYLIEGRFESYFKDKPMPEKPAAAEQEEAAPEAGTEQPAATAAPAAEQSPIGEITERGFFQEQSPPAKILVVGSSEMIKNNLLDEEGESTNAMFVLNAIDALNGREEVAVMRSKVQRFNPVEETTPVVKTLIKTVNMVGLPVLVVFCGGLVWLRRQARRKNIQALFQQK